MIMQGKVCFCTAIVILTFPLGSVAQIDDVDDSKRDAMSAFQETSQALEEFNLKHSRIFQDAIVPIHYLDCGEADKDATPLVLLHGTYSSAHDFVRFVPRMIKAGYRPISIDWYGHGKTPIPQAEVTAADFANDLKSLLESLKIQKAFIAGHSRGGTLATEFYRLYPDHVSGLILIDGGSTCMADVFADLGEKGVAQIADARFDENGTPRIPTFDSIEELFSSTWERFGRPTDVAEMYDVISQAGRNRDGRWTRMRESILEWLGQDTRENTFNGMRTPERAPSFFRSTVLLDPMNVFKDLQVPVLILDATGSHDGYWDSTPTEANERLQTLHPELITLIKMRTGHFLHRERPDEFVDQLRKFRQNVNK